MIDLAAAALYLSLSVVLVHMVALCSQTLENLAVFGSGPGFGRFTSLFFSSWEFARGGTSLWGLLIALESDFECMFARVGKHLGLGRTQILLIHFW